MSMIKTKTGSAKPKLSKVAVDPSGRLRYRSLPWKVIVAQMVRDFPPIAAMMVAALGLIFALSAARLVQLYQLERYTGEIMLHIYLAVVCAGVATGTLCFSYRQAKDKLNHG